MKNIGWRTRCCYDCWNRYRVRSNVRGWRTWRRWFCRACWWARLRPGNYQYHLVNQAPTYIPRAR